MKVNKYNFYLLTLGILINLYMLNLFATIGNIKIFNFLIPLVLFIYIYINKIKINIEIKTLYIFVISMVISLSIALFNTPSILLISNTTLKVTVIILLLLPLYQLYKSNYKLFDNLFIFTIVNTIIANYYFYFLIYDHSSRFRGTFGNPNEFSLVLLFMIYFVLFYMYIYKITYKNNILKKLFLIFLVIALTLLVLITLSRSGTIILLLFFISYYLAIKQKIHIVYKLFLMVIIMLILYYLYNSFFREFELLFNRFMGDDGIKTSHSRIYQVIAGANTIENNLYSIVFGTGTASTSDEVWFRHYYDVSGIIFYRIHNTLMSLLVENGFIGLLVYLFFHFLLIKKIIKLKDTYKYALIGYILGAFIYSQGAYIVYFFPYWLGLIFVSLHAERLQLIKQRSLNEKL